MKTQRVTPVVEAEAVGDLGVEQADDMAPGTEAAGLFIHASFAGQTRHQMWRKLQIWRNKENLLAVGLR